MLAVLTGLSANRVDETKVTPKHFLVKEQASSQSLVLGAGSDMLRDGEVRKEVTDFPFAIVI